MFFVHIIVSEEIATEIIWLLSRKLFQKVFAVHTNTPTVAGVSKFIHFGERFQKVPFLVTENAILVWTEGLSG